MKKVFKVAGFDFAIVMPDDERAWESMQNYEPFVTEDTGNYIFTAELVDTMPDTTGKQLVVASNMRADMPRAEMYDWDGKWLFEFAPTMEAPVRVIMLADKGFTYMKFRFRRIL